MANYQGYNSHYKVDFYDRSHNLICTVLTDTMRFAQPPIDAVSQNVYRRAYSDMLGRYWLLMPDESGKVSRRKDTKIVESTDNQKQD